jgi:transposase
MKRVKEVLRLAHELGYSNRQIEVSVRLGRTTVGGYLARARAAGVRYADVAEMSETVIAALLFKCPEPSMVRPQPDWSAVAAEMRRRGVTLLLLWQEYRDQHPDGYSYSQFRRYYRAHQRLSGGARLRRTPVPAAMCEVDYAGQTMMVATPRGERQASVFVGSLPFSTAIYAEASWTQGTEDWLGSHVRMFDSWGGSVPKLVPDNLKTGISHASFYDPAINRSYLEFARHYGIGVVPARVRKPRDKPLAENAVQQVERWVLAPLRNRVFFSLDDLNRAIRQGVAALNDRPLSADSTLTRARLFEAHEKPLLQALPSEPFEIGRWYRYKVPSDYHVVIEGVAYSVPYRLIGKSVDVHRTASLVSIFHKGERVASHARRLAEPGMVRLAVSLDEHRPASHRAVLRLSPEAVRATITAFGGAVAALADMIFQDADHPEQAARQVAGLMRLGACYGTTALQAAAAAALSANVRSYRYVRQWLASGQMTGPTSSAEQPGGGAGLHHNVRGSTYYH